MKKPAGLNKISSHCQREAVSFICSFGSEHMFLEGTTGGEQAQETMLKEGMNVFMLLWAKKYFEEIVRHFCDIHF